MDFGWPNAEIGQKMANGQQLFLALYLKFKYVRNSPVFSIHNFLWWHTTDNNF